MVVVVDLVDVLEVVRSTLDLLFDQEVLVDVLVAIAMFISIIWSIMLIAVLIPIA